MRSAAGLLVAATFATPARAENIVGVDGTVVLPLGDYGDGVSLALGPLARVDIPAGPGFATVRGGFLINLTEIDGALLLMFPVYGGYRYPIGRSGYLSAELGPTISYARFETDLGSGSETSFDIGFTLGGGLRKGQLDLHAGLFSPDVDLVGIMGSVGYDFTSF